LVFTLVVDASFTLPVKPPKYIPDIVDNQNYRRHQHQWQQANAAIRDTHDSPQEIQFIHGQIYSPSQQTRCVFEGILEIGKNLGVVI
jgi:hypothetical protein